MTEDMAMVFAETIRESLDATWGIAELGIAGPTGSAYGYDAGMSVIAVAGPVALSETVQTGHNDREKNMEQFTQRAIELLGKAVSSQR